MNIVVPTAKKVVYWYDEFYFTKEDGLNETEILLKLIDGLVFRT